MIDLSGRVRYPLSSENRDVWLLFNGEIYGHRALKSDLERRGHTFATDCDAEVVVHGFEEWDTDVFRRLDGMFACAVVDERDGRLVLARDRFGIKPLVHTTGTKRFAFSSDAISLVRAGLSDGEVDIDAVTEFAAFHYMPPPRTGLTDVVDLRPGTALVLRRDGSREVTTWAPLLLAGTGRRGAVSLEEVDSALDAAVRRQLMADVPVGVLLSSGIDSALILAYAVESGASPQAFTIAFPGAGDYDESAGAAEIAHALGVGHEVQAFDAGFVDAVGSVARAFDRPFADSSAVATLQLARLARTKATVVLSGSGGDELFAGYYRIRAHRVRRYARALSPFLGGVGSNDIQGSERTTRGGLFGSYARRMLAGDLSDDVSQYLSLVGDATSEAGLSVMDVPPDLRRARLEVGSRFGLEPGNLAAPLRELARFEYATYLSGDVLVKEDRATMRVGLEARVPMLDGRLAELVGLMPDGDKASLLVGKRPLRAIAKRRLTGVRSKRAKRGFAVPLAQLFRGRWAGESVSWIEAQRSGLMDTRKMARSVRSGSMTAPDFWALSTLLAWESRLCEERSIARASG